MERDIVALPVMITIWIITRTLIKVGQRIDAAPYDSSRSLKPPPDPFLAEGMETFFPIPV